MPNQTDGGPGSESPALIVENLTKRFDDVTALDGLTMSVARGEVLAVLGPNGAGKTTAINILATLLRADSGTAIVAGHDVQAEPHEVRAHLLEEFSLTEAANKRVRTYSGGMRRRLDLAASLVVPAEVVFLDEPTTGLDPRSRNELWDVVRQMREDGLTIVLTTQYLEEADQLAERIIVIDKGTVIAEGTPAQLKAAAGGSSAVAVPVEPERLSDLAAALVDIGATTVDDEADAVIVAGGGSGHLAPIVLRAQEAGIALADVSVRTPTLEDVFLQLTDHGIPQPAEAAS